MPVITYREFDALTRIHFWLFMRRVFAELNPRFGAGGRMLGC